MKTKLSLNQEAVAAFARVLVALIIVSVIGYAEVMFLQVMSRVFPDGILKIVSMLGAVATGASVLVLLVAKSYWFRPGKQLVFAWIFTGAELLVLVLNVILSFTLSNGHVSDSYLSVWYTFMPASPILALLGWIIILHLDQAQQERHAELELEVEQRQEEREHRRAVHQARMELKHAFLKSHVTYLQEEVNSPELQRQIQVGASLLAARELSELTNTHIAPRLGMSASSMYPALPVPALSPEPRTVSGELVSDDSYLARVNERIEQERRARLAREEFGQGEDSRVGALVHSLLPAAEQHSSQLARVERLLGLELRPGETLPMDVRLERIVRWALAHGYSTEDVMNLASRYLGENAQQSRMQVKQEQTDDGEALALWESLYGTGLAEGGDGVPAKKG